MSYFSERISTQRCDGRDVLLKTCRKSKRTSGSCVVEGFGATTVEMVITITTQVNRPNKKNVDKLCIYARDYVNVGVHGVRGDERRKASWPS